MPKLLYVFFILLLLPGWSMAQEQASASMLPDSLPVKKELRKLDTNMLQYQDSLLQVLAALKDSLQFSRELDSLRELSLALDTLRMKQNLDSLRQLQLPTEQLQAKIDSLQGRLDVQTRVNSEIERLEKQLSQPLAKSRQHLQEKIDQATSLEGVSQEGLANLKEQTGLEMDVRLPEIEGIGLENVEGMALPKEVPSVDMTDLTASGIELPVLEDLNLEIEGVEVASEGISKLKGLTKEAEVYTEELTEISQGRLQDVERVDELAEKKFLQSGGGKAFQQQFGESQGGIGELKQLTGESYLKEQGKEKVYKAAVDHFAGKQDKLDAARAQMAKYKGRFGKVKSVKEMPKGFFKLNPLKGTPWHERVVLGSLWQFGKQEQFIIDLGPTLAWRFTDRLSAGIGYQYRLNIQTKQKPWVNTSDKVYGFQVFGDYGFKKGFFGRLIYEDLNTAVPRFNATQKVESTEQQWIKGLSVGLGKKYTFYKSLQGFSLVQYNVLHRQHKTPYTQPLQVKIGFYIVGKKLRKQEEKK